MGFLKKVFGGKKKDNATYPSWTNNHEKLEEYFSILKEKAKSKNIPEKFLGGILTTEYTQNTLLFKAGLMEQQGASFEQQTVAVMDHIERYWSNTDDKETWFK